MGQLTEVEQYYETPIDHEDPDTLRELYWGHGLSLRAIADLSPVSNDTILDRMDSFGIPRRDKTHTEPIEVRFWNRVEEGAERDCWVWTASKSRGYGQIRFDGELWKAHRLSMLLHGEDPSGKNVLHTCDNKACVNPNHLYFGSKRDNMIDAIENGKLPEYDGWNRPKLNGEKVKEIRSKYKAGEYSQMELAEEYGVHPTSICNAINGVTWSDV